MDRGRRYATASGLFLLLCLSCGASAQTGDTLASGEMTITAEVVEDVTLNVTPLDFPAFTSTDASTATRTAEGLITVNAPDGLAFEIRINRGQHSDNNINRFLRAVDGDDTMRYRLYQEAALTTEWGTGDQSSPDNYIRPPVNTTGTGADQVFPVYGRVERGTGTTLGEYADTVTVSIVTTD